MPVTPTPAPIYTSERFGVSFDLPSGWKEVGEDHFAGPDGFVQVEPFESVANTTLRVCDWEMNLHPERYGSRPRADIIGPEPFIEQPPCKIIPSADAADQMILLVRLGCCILLVIPIVQMGIIAGPALPGGVSLF